MTIENFKYPFTIGNTWIYSGFQNFSTYSDSLLFYHESIDTVIIDSLYNEIDSIYRFKISNKLIEYNYQNYMDTMITFNKSYQYSSNQNSPQAGLYHHGYSNATNNWIFPRSKTNNKIKFKIGSHLLDIDQLRNLIDITYVINDSIIWESSPLLSIKYPVILNDVWEYRGINMPFKMDRKVINIDTENELFTIKTLYNFNNTLDTLDEITYDNNLNVFHTFSRSGLISFEAISDSMIVMYPTSDSLPMILDSLYARVIWNYSLIESQVVID